MGNTLLVTIESRGRIPLIAADGPILVPTPLSKSLVSKLVMSGVKVNECNPNDVHQTVRITRANLNENRFPPVIPTPEVHPTGKEVPTVNLVAPVPTSIMNEETSTEEVSEEISEDTSEEKPATQAQPPVFDKYAGLSKNQRKRLRQQEAAAAAAAAKESEKESHSPQE